MVHFIRGFFKNDMYYINSRFTYLLINAWVCDPLTTCAIPQRFCDKAASQRAAISSVLYLYLYDELHYAICV